MIDTNGFITKYIKATQEQLHFEKEIERLNNALIEPYEKIKEIEENYNISTLEKQRKDLLISIKDNNKVKTFYYFRSIIDGIYNLLQEYGWKYSAELFGFLKDKYRIRCCFEDGFDVYYIDTICDMTPATIFNLEYLNDMTSFIILSEYDTCDEIKLPDNLSIDEVLTDAQGLLKELVKLDNQKEQNEEYELYKRLKKKYEPIESGDGIN